MCQAKITDHYNIKYKCLLPDKYSITSKITSKNGITKNKTKILCEKHAHILRKNLNYRIKHLGGIIEFEQTEIKLLA